MYASYHSNVVTNMADRAPSLPKTPTLQLSQGFSVVISTSFLSCLFYCGWLQGTRACTLPVV
jgi:hypothetical protein